MPSYLRVDEVSSCSNAWKIACLFLGLDADAGVRHREAQAHLRRAGAEPDLPSGAELPGGFHQHHDLAAFGELDGVAYEIDEHLAQPAGVADQRIGHAGPLLANQFQPLFVRTHGQRAHGGAQDGTHREIGRVQFEAARLDLGEVQDVVDDAEERRPPPT